MSIVNFAVTRPLEKKINQTIKEQGFTSKAEFFRFVTLLYLSRPQPLAAIEETAYQKSVSTLKIALRKRLVMKKLPSLHNQLAGLL